MGARPASGSTGKFGILTAAIAASVALLGGGIASATADDEKPPPSNDKQVPNLGKAKERIKEYYGDYEADGEHYASADSNYAKQVHRIQRRAKQYLGSHLAGKSGDAKPAIVLDVDDTTLLTYNYELQEDFGYDEETNDDYIQAQKMRAVFGMRKLVNWAEQKGYTVFFLTGRPESQRDATEGNLHKTGYKPKADDEHLYLKNEENPPPYLDCGSDCTTIEYKSQTRAHIESQGHEIVANFGDQKSDLKGGYADRRYKLPNPMYYLP